MPSPTGPVPTPDVQAGARPVRPVLVLATSILASSLAILDGSVINVGLPAIQRSFGSGAADLQWVINAYLLPLSALLLLGGALGDRFGRRTLLALGVGLFALGSGACALAPSLGWLLAGRALQGLGAAMLLPSSLAVLGAAFPGEKRARAVGVWAAVSAMASALGPVLGGWLIDTVGWRAIFLINLPLCAGALALCLLVLRDPTRERQAPLDVLGGVLATAALGLTTWGLTTGSGPRGWSIAAVAAAASGAVLAAAFVLVESRKGETALTPPALFASRSFVGLNLMTLLLYGALSGYVVLVPYLLIEGLGYRATGAGAALLPFPLIMSAGAPVTGALAGRYGARWLLAAGCVIVAAGLVLAIRITPGASYWSGVLPSVILLALGMSCAAAPLTSAVLSSVDDAHEGSASGLNSAVARTGGLVVTALLGAVLAARGEALLANFRIAALAGAGLAVIAGVIAFTTLARRRDQPRERSRT